MTSEKTWSRSYFSSKASGGPVWRRYLSVVLHRITPCCRYRTSKVTIKLQLWEKCRIWRRSGFYETLIYEAFFMLLSRISVISFIQVDTGGSGTTMSRISRASTNFRASANIFFFTLNIVIHFFEPFNLKALQQKKRLFFPLLYSTVILFAQLFVTFTVCMFFLNRFIFVSLHPDVSKQSGVETQQAFLSFTCHWRQVLRGP